MSHSTPFYGGEALSVIERLPVKAEPQENAVVVQSQFMYYLPLIIAVVTLALTLYMLSEQKKKGRSTK
jgi:hypothetical protein